MGVWSSRRRGHHAACSAASSAAKAPRGRSRPAAASAHGRPSPCGRPPERAHPRAGRGRASSPLLVTHRALPGLPALGGESRGRQHHGRRKSPERRAGRRRVLRCRGRSRDTSSPGRRARSWEWRRWLPVPTTAPSEQSVIDPQRRRVRHEDRTSGHAARSRGAARGAPRDVLRRVYGHVHLPRRRCPRSLSRTVPCPAARVTSARSPPVVIGPLRPRRERSPQRAAPGHAPARFRGAPGAITAGAGAPSRCEGGHVAPLGPGSSQGRVEGTARAARSRAERVAARAGHGGARWARGAAGSPMRAPSPSSRSRSAVGEASQRDAFSRST